MKIKKTFQGELPENRIVNTYSDSLTDAYSANYLNGKLSNVVISATEPTDKKDIWVQIGKNLFDKTKIINNLSPTSDGGFTGASGCSTSYVKVNPGDTYMVSSNVERPWVFNFSKDIPSIGVVATPWNVANGNAFQVVVPDGFEYISFRHLPSSPGEDNINQDIQVEQGEFKTDYEPYIPKKIYVKKDNRYEVVYDEANTRKEVYVGPYEPRGGEDVWIKSGKNLFNKANILSGYELVSTEAEIQANAEWYVSDFIPVTPGVTYFLSGKTSGTNNIFYDADKKKIDGIGATTGALLIPNGAKYMRFNGRLTEIDTVQLEIGDEATAYENYVNTNIFAKSDNGGYNSVYDESVFSRNSMLLRQTVNSTQGSWKNVPVNPNHKFLVLIIVGSNNSDVKTIPINLIKKFGPSDPIKIIVNGTTIVQLAYSGGYIVEYIWTSGYKVEHYSY